MRIRNFIKINVMVSLLAFLSACSQDDISTDKNVAPEKTVITERQVTQEQALNFSEQAFKALLENESEQLGESDLKSRANSVKGITKKVEKVYTDDGKVALYIVNFGNNGGYLVISGDKESSSIVLSYNSVGSLNYSTLDKTSTVALWLEAKRQEISKKLNSGKNSDNEESYLIWDGFNTKTKEESTLKLLTTENLKYNTEKATNNNFESLKPRSVVVNNTWGQGQGYNADAKNGALIGCPAVAVGLICRYFTFPTGANFDYANMPKRLNNVRTSNPISRMLRAVADNIPNYDWGVNPGDESGAYTPDIETGLRNLGYKNADLRTYELGLAYNNIKDYGPILLGGVRSSDGAAHIWVADGYVKYSFQICRNNQIIVRSQELLFMNWGWNGYGNGWVDQNEWKPNARGQASFDDNRFMYVNLYPVK